LVSFIKKKGNILNKKVKKITFCQRLALIRFGTIKTQIELN